MTERSFAPRITMHTVFYAAWFVFLSSIFIRNVFDIRFNIIIVLALACLPAIVGDRNEIIALAISLIPMTAAFQYKYALLFIMAVYIVKYFRDLKYMNGFLLLMVMFAWELLHGFMYDFSLLNSIRGFAELIFCAFLMSLSIGEFKYEKILRMLVISTTVAGTIVLLNLLTENNFDLTAIFAGGYRFGKGDITVTEYGMNYNANDLGMIFNAAICSVFYLIKLKRARLVDYIMFSALLFYGIFTQSRAFIICFAFIMFLFIISYGNLKSKFKLSFTIIFIVAIAVSLFNMMLPDVLSNFISRFGEEDISNGRMDLFKLYGNLILSNLTCFIFGIGMQNISSKAHNLNNEIIASPHNGTQEIIVAWGIIGLVLMIAFVATMVHRSKMLNKKLRLAGFIMLLFILLHVQSSQFITAEKSLLVFAFSYICLFIDSGKEEVSYE